MSSNKNDDDVSLPAPSHDDETADPDTGQRDRPSPDGRPAVWLDRVDGEIERLRIRWSEAQAELDRCEARNRELEKANARLRAEVDDLHAYIDGRKEHWAEMQKRIEQYEDTLAGMEQVARDAEERLSRKDGERELLSGRIIELERRCAQLAGRLKERERSQRDLERKLEEHRELAKAAEAEKNERIAQQIRSLRQELVAQQQLIDKLETELDAKQRTIETLQRQVGSSGRSADGPAAARADGDAGRGGGDDRDDARDGVEIIRIGELFRHHSGQAGRQPIAVLEAPDGTRYPVTKSSVTIGRASTNDICIRREFVSRTHARLTVQGIGAIIEDVGSKNGILVNSEPVERRLLADGDTVSLGGKLDLKYVEIDGPPRVGVPGERANTES